ncbi:hypothetical protein HHK36_019863 [Tetracentron sinense]|uniref:KANL3/Tex30 alpha/beta hydrolase-like domain-containing protein n=1 Tax=Tetracentron sinense TaxID=13715 RepID=A0A835D9Z6_TETSI|nr:hypothetical protein HHK36_019863 [Tetracentron sinense]
MIVTQLAAFGTSGPTANSPAIDGSAQDFRRDVPFDMPHSPGLAPPTFFNRLPDPNLQSKRRGQANLQGLLKGIAVGLAERGHKAVTFDMRGVGRSTGWPSLTGSSEIRDVVAVCKWVCENMSTHRILLVGSSAGVPISGSAVDKIKQVVGYISLGYPFGLMASILFGRHHKAILQSPKPKLFVMGTRDGFTSVKQLNKKLKSAAGRVETHLIEGVSHFQMEGPSYDAQMVDLILVFIASL